MTTTEQESVDKRIEERIKFTLKVKQKYQAKRLEKGIEYCQKYSMPLNSFLVSEAVVTRKVSKANVRKSFLVSDL